MDIGSIAKASLAPTALAANEQVVKIPPEERELIRAVRAIGQTRLFGPDKELTFVLDRETNRALVRIIRTDTKEVLLQIPAKHALEMAREMAEHTVPRRDSVDERF
jgi:uncharacterized FlaG/YvyC family protein